jgi:ring-1,2-phenylacetyl-CoA epoxidase subunit PaaD
VVTVTGPDRARGLAQARAAAAGVVDPELPMLTLEDLGVLRAVRVEGDRAVVEITPTYSGCPATATMRADLRLALARAGFEDAEVRTVLSPAWTTDWITERGRQALRRHGIAPPARVAGPERAGSADLVLLPTPAAPPQCPRCGSSSTREVSRFGASPCTSQHACRECAEPFDRVKPL